LQKAKGLNKINIRNRIMPKRGNNNIGIALYFLLLGILLFLLVLHVFGLYPLQTDFFARYLIALVFVLLLLPIVPKIKLFEFIDVKRETKMFKAARKK
jgi:Ca2+/Na+ antiporter